MALDAIINAEAHAKLNPVIQAEYTKQADGRFIATINPYEESITDPATGKKTSVRFALEDVGGLKTTLATLRTEVGEAAARNKAFEGLDPAIARNALAKVEEMKNWTPEQKVQEQIKAREEQLETKHKEQLVPLQATNQSLLQQLDDVLGAQTARVALKAAGATAAGLELLMPHVQNRIKAKDGASGKRVAVVVDANGNPQVTNRPGSNDPMSIDELVLSFKKEHAGCFAGSGASGGGAPGTGSSGQGGSQPTVNPNASPTEKLRAARKAKSG